MEIISPKMDFAFRELMEDDEVRRYFICDALNISVEQVKETRLGSSFLRRQHQKMKQGILDVKIFLQDGTRINLEMQLRRQKFWEKRSLYYLAKMYADILFVGEHFDRLRRCIGNSRLDDWIRLFNAETEEDLQMIKTKNAGVQRAKYVIQVMSLVESLRDAWEYHRKKKMDRYCEDAYVYDQGKEAGQQEILIDLVQRGKLDVETAAETCGITQKEFEQKLEEAKMQNQ